MAFILPIGGFVIAIWRFGRGDIGPGIAALLVSCLSFAVAAVLIANGAFRWAGA